MKRNIENVPYRDTIIIIIYYSCNKYVRKDIKVSQFYRYQNQDANLIRYNLYLFDIKAMASIGVSSPFHNNVVC